VGLGGGRLAGSVETLHYVNYEIHVNRMAAAELRHALADCGCFGGPDGRRAHQLVQLGTGAEDTRVL
jgi:hypothetical protein